MLDRLKKLLGVTPKNGQDSVKRISQSIQAIHSDEETQVFDSGSLEYSQNLMAKKFDLISSVLEQAKEKAAQFESLVSEIIETETAKTDPKENFQNIVQEIIDNCNDVSVNGLKILAGDELNVNVNEKQLKIQLPNLVNSLGLIQSDVSSASDLQNQVEELTTAIFDSELELEKYLVELEIAEQNLHSAGISVAWLKNAIIHS